MRTLWAKKKWLPWLKANCISSSGGSLRTLRKTLWGEDAYVVRCDGMLFMVSEEKFAELEKII